jgi:hypothetical protein
MLQGMRYRLRKGYFFGYVDGAGAEDMIPAVAGERPSVIGAATLDGYELRIQALSEITSKGANPQDVLRKTWGGSFQSYVLVKKPGSQVRGVLLRLSVKARHALDSWELVESGWCKRAYVMVRLDSNGRLYRAETQVLADGQEAGQTVSPIHGFWLMPKRQFIRLARAARGRH